MKHLYIFSNQAVINIGLAALLSIGLACGIAGKRVPEADLDPATLAGSQPASSSPKTANGKMLVYLLRGVNDIYSLGLDALAVKLVDRGIPALSMSGTNWPTLAAAIEQAYADGSWRGDLVFVGHSYGCDNAISLAVELDKLDIRVRLLLLLDATDPQPIPKNVDRCVHYYIPSIFAELLPDKIPGRPVQAEAGNDHTEIVNQIVSVEQLGPAVAGLDHFSIDDSDFLHQLMIEEVLKLTPSQP